MQDRRSAPGNPPPDEPGDLTTLHVRGAARGRPEDLEWIVARFTPLLFAQARYRMGEQLLALHDPEDVVGEVWAVALPRLAELPLRDGRATPVLVRFLTTTVLHQVNNLFRKRLAEPAGGDTPDASDPLDRLPRETRGPVTRALRVECRGLVTQAIDALQERDREVIVLRAIEQHSNQETAAMLGLPPNTAAQVYRRALEKLRARLTGSVFEELAVQES